MKFRYKKYSSQVLRPVIPFEMVFNNNAVRYEALIDSGADLCIFDAKLGKGLGIPIESGEKRIVSGVTGKPEFYYLHRITIIVGGWKHKATVGFMPKMSVTAYGILGQIGFFDHYSVKFDLNKQEIELKESLNPRLN